MRNALCDDMPWLSLRSRCVVASTSMVTIFTFDGAACVEVAFFPLISPVTSGISPRLFMRQGCFEPTAGKYTQIEEETVISHWKRLRGLEGIQ